MNIEAALPKEPATSATPSGSISGINFRVSPNSPISPLPEWGIYNRELWSIELSHDRVDRERVTGGDINEKARLCTAKAVGLWRVGRCAHDEPCSLLLTLTVAF